jgi:hypothetical protein
LPRQRPLNARLFTPIRADSVRLPFSVRQRSSPFTRFRRWIRTTTSASALAWNRSVVPRTAAVIAGPCLRALNSFGVTASPLRRATRTTVQVRAAATASTLPVGSVARTRSVCLPRPRPVSVRGGAHGVKAAPSRLQRNVDPGSERKRIVAFRRVVRALGPPVMIVFGRTRSIGSLSNTGPMTFAGTGASAPVSRSYSRTAPLPWSSSATCCPSLSTAQFTSLPVGEFGTGTSSPPPRW